LCKLFFRIKIKNSAAINRFSDRHLPSDTDEDAEDVLFVRQKKIVLLKELPCYCKEQMNSKILIGISDPSNIRTRDNKRFALFLTRTEFVVCLNVDLRQSNYSHESPHNSVAYAFQDLSQT
jgi:hypothetical protein